MKVLWITNILFPEAESIITGRKELKESGGWLIGAAQAFERFDNIELFVATVSKLVQDLTVLHGRRITYYILPYGKGNLTENKEYESIWAKVKTMISPNIVHIHGTEFSHGLSYINSCGNDGVVVSIQGMKSIHYLFYYAGLQKREIIKHITFRDIVKGGIISNKCRFEKQGKYEIKIISSVNHIIGRTSWDKANTWAINPNAIYYFCNETLRNEFYDDSKWLYENCDRHTIFLSQAGYPLKGLHQVLKAMPIILRHYPDAKIRVSGYNITNSKGLKNILRLSGYGSIIKSLIKQYKLEQHIEFIGPLNAEEMKQEYLRCNVFICPSSSENSPNSIGEAQILGTPVVASYVGGIMDMMRGDEDHLYRFDEVNMLAHKVCDVFENINYNNMIKIAKERHDPYANAQSLLNIYNQILVNR